MLIDVFMQRGSTGGEQYGRRLYDDVSRRPLTDTTSERRHRPRLFDESTSVKSRHQHQQQRRVQFDDQVYGTSARRTHSLTADLTATKYDIGMVVCVFSYYTVSQKGSIKPVAITLSNLNGFSKFLHR